MTIRALRFLISPSYPPLLEELSRNIFRILVFPAKPFQAEDENEGESEPYSYGKRLNEVRTRNALTYVMLDIFYTYYYDIYSIAVTS
jgi:hypothetical protein